MLEKAVFFGLEIGILQMKESSDYSDSSCHSIAFGSAFIEIGFFVLFRLGSVFEGRGEVAITFYMRHCR